MSDEHLTPEPDAPVLAAVPVPDDISRTAGAPQSIDVRNWFWIVTNFAGGNDVYSAAAAVYMAQDDSRYTDWTSQGNVATVILSDGELADVLTKRAAPYAAIVGAG